MNLKSFSCTGLLAICCQTVNAEIEFFVDVEAWADVAGGATTIDFTGFPNNTVITDQYSDLGVEFVELETIIGWNPISFPNDGWGMDGEGSIHLVFDAPRLAIAATFPGAIRFRLFSDGELVGLSPGFGSSGPVFVGITSTAPFDEVIIEDPSDGAAFIDDLYFGPPIPAPSALGLLACAGFVCRRRRR